MAVSKINGAALGNASGNVGIGTSSPSATAGLTVAGTTGNGTGGGILITGSGYQTNPAGLLLGQYTSTIAYLQAPAGGQIDIWDDASNSIAQFKDNGDFRFNSGYGTAGVAYGCRAWVNFNGTGTVAIRASGNVSSITDNGTGDYTINFTTAMPDANYSVTSGTVGNVNPYLRVLNYGINSASAVRMYGFFSSDNASNVIALADLDFITVAIFR
jgi:hypothetical protein